MLVKWVTGRMRQCVSFRLRHVPPLTKSDGIYESKRCWQSCMWGGSSGRISEKSLRKLPQSKSFWRTLMDGSTFKQRKMSSCSHGWRSQLREGGPQREAICYSTKYLWVNLCRRQFEKKFENLNHAWRTEYLGILWDVQTEVRSGICDLTTWFLPW